jgi:hypothetical protein
MNAVDRYISMCHRNWILTFGKKTAFLYNVSPNYVSILDAPGGEGGRG